MQSCDQLESGPQITENIIVISCLLNDKIIGRQYETEHQAKQYDLIRHLLTYNKHVEGLLISHACRL